MRSEQHGEFVIERGAQFIASSYRNMRALAAELGIAELIAPLSDTRNAVLRGGVFVLTDYEGLGALRKSRDLSLFTKLRLLGLAWPLWRNWKRLDFYHPERAARLDTESAAAYAERRFGREAVDYLIEPAFAGTFTVLPEEMSKAFMLSTLATILKGFRLLSFRGGNGVLTRTLAEHVPVRLGAAVERVEAGEKGLTLRIVGEKAAKFDAAVIAVPGNAVAGLCPKLTDGEQTFFFSVRYASSIIAFVLAGAEALPPFYGAGMTRREGVRLYGMAVENAKAGVVPPGKTLFNCAFAEDLAAELMDQPDEVLTAALMAELRKLPLRGLDSIEEVVIHRWPALVPQFYPGYHKALRRFLRRRERTGRLFFAGDYLVGPYTEAALTSGLRAADEAARALADQGAVALP
jgi:oxygen-dependent protoporphyrinogen oxidase